MVYVVLLATLKCQFRFSNIPLRTIKRKLRSLRYSPHTYRKLVGRIRESQKHSDKDGFHKTEGLCWGHDVGIGFWWFSWSLWSQEYSGHYFAREYEDLRCTQCQNKFHGLGKHTYVYCLNTNILTFLSYSVMLVLTFISYKTLPVSFSICMVILY